MMRFIPCCHATAVILFVGCYLPTAYAEMPLYMQSPTASSEVEPESRPTESSDLDQSNTAAPTSQTTDAGSGNLDWWEESSPVNGELMGEVPKFLQKFLAVLCLAVAGILILSFLGVGKRFRTTGVTSHASMQIRQTMTIGPRSKLHLIDVNGTQFVVGVDAQGVQQMLLLDQGFDDLIPETTDEEPWPVSEDTSSAREWKRDQHAQ